MSGWSEIINRHREKHGLSAWDNSPESHYSLLASVCGEQELVEMRARLADLDRQEAEIPEWDGESLDGLRGVRYLFSAILKIHEKE